MDSVRGYFEFNLLFQLVGFVACYKRFERLVTMGTGSLSPVEFFENVLCLQCVLRVGIETTGDFVLKSFEVVQLRKVF